MAIGMIRRWSRRLENVGLEIRSNSEQVLYTGGIQTGRHTMRLNLFHEGVHYYEELDCSKDEVHVVLIKTQVRGFAEGLIFIRDH